MASITVEQRNELTVLAIAMFNAAPGAQVLSQLVSAREAGASLEGIAAALATKPQFEEVYPSFLTAEEFADRVVDNLLTPDTPAGAQTWAKNWILGQLNAGATPASILLNAARALVQTSNSNYESAKDQLLNKLEVANYYSVEKEQPSTNLADLQAVLENVTADPASVDQAKQEIDNNLDGEDFTLTTGADTFKGSSGADVFRALTVDGDGDPASTLTAFDNLDGGAGVDTLELYVAAGFNDTWPGNVSIKNIEIININADGAPLGPTVDASKFVGATQINQKALASKVINLGSGTTAGFYELGGALAVDAADAATSASINFFNVADSATLTVEAGAAGTLDTVNITGNVVDVPADKTLDPVATAIKVGKDVETLTLNSAVAVELTVNDGAGSKKVSTVDASGSTGALKYNAAATVANIKSGSANDTLTLNTAFTASLKSASVSSGEGDDKVEVNLAAGGNKGVTAEVDTGDGKDEIRLINIIDVAVEVKAGAGDDTVYLNTIGDVTEEDLIDGGAGFDTVVTDGKALVAEDYILLDEVLKNFEGVRFVNAGAIVEADRLSAYKVIEFHGGASTATGVASDQKLVTSVDLDATAAGYKAGPPVTYAGTLDITAGFVNAGDTLTLTANADTINLAVTAGASNKDGAVDQSLVTLKGDAKSISVSFTASLDNKGNADPSDDVNEIGVVILDTATDHKELTSFKAVGNGGVVLNNDANAKLATIDLSGLDSKAPDGTLAPASIITSSADIAETYKLGNGVDQITLGNSTVVATDVIEGLNLVEDEATPGVLDATSDLLGLSISGGFTTATITGGSLNLALTNAAALADDRLVFTFNGDTYIYADIGATADEVDDDDLLVKLVGTSVDIELLAANL